MMPMADNTLAFSAAQIASKPKRRSYGTALILGSAGVVTLSWISLIGWAFVKVVSL